MIVAFMNAPDDENRNGRTIPIAMSATAIARLDHGGGPLPPAPAAPPAAVRATRSSGFPRLLTEQTARAQDHDGDQVAEYDRLGPLRPQAGIGQRLDDADDQAAEHSTADVADAAHDGRRERDQSGLEALEVPDVRLIERVHEPRSAGQHAAEKEGERDRGVDVDTHQ